MTERLGCRLRPTGMRTRALGILLALPLVVAGCGDAGDEGSRAASSPTATSSWCRSDTAPVELLEADIDGDGTPDAVDYHAPGGGCPGSLSSPVEGLQAVPVLDWTAAPTPADAAAVDVPGRRGQLVLLLEQHPRGGFLAHLFGYADGKLAELEVDGNPVLPFVATDVMTDPLSARCVDGGFEVTAATAHTPIGVVPAWDVSRTTYAVDGNAVTKVATDEVADNVLDKELHQQYRDLVRYSLFENCRAGS